LPGACTGLLSLIKGHPVGAVFSFFHFSYGVGLKAPDTRAGTVWWPALGSRLSPPATCGVQFNSRRLTTR